MNPDDAYERDPDHRQQSNLNAYHRARNERMVKKVSEQRLMSPEESMEQMKRIAQSSSREVVNSGN